MFWSGTPLVDSTSAWLPASKGSNPLATNENGGRLFACGLYGCGDPQPKILAAVVRGGVRGQTVSVQAATTLMRAERRERGFRLITILTSWSSAVRKVISRSTEKPAIL